MLHTRQYPMHASKVQAFSLKWQRQSQCQMVIVKRMAEAAVFSRTLIFNSGIVQTQMPDSPEVINNVLTGPWKFN